MRRILFALLPCLCLLLTGCGDDEHQALRERLRERLISSQSLSFQAEVRAEYESKTARFVLGYERDGSGAQVEVLSPQLIAGVKARVGPDGTSLEYDSLMLGTGDLDSYGLSPMSCLPLLVQAMEEGALTASSRDGELTMLELQSRDELICRIWLEGEEPLPRRAELISSGRVMVYIELSAWQEGQ